MRDTHNGNNVYWSEIESETINEYQCARDTLEGQGFSLKAVVIDGRPGVRKLFADLPVQMCQFHQKAIITRYLTRCPKLEAGKELREIVHSLCNSNEQTFTDAIDAWHQKWNEFLKERTVECPLSSTGQALQERQDSFKKRKELLRTTCVVRIAFTNCMKIAEVFKKAEQILAPVTSSNYGNSKY